MTRLVALFYSFCDMIPNYADDYGMNEPEIFMRMDMKLAHSKGKELVPSVSLRDGKLVIWGNDTKVIPLNNCVEVCWKYYSDYHNNSTNEK